MSKIAFFFRIVSGEYPFETMYNFLESFGVEFISKYILIFSRNKGSMLKYVVTGVYPLHNINRNRMKSNI